MALRQYVDMELDDDAKLDGGIVTPAGTRVPDYPYALRISLSATELQKLGIDDDPKVGDLLHFAAFAEVTSYSSGDGEGGPHRRVELQIRMISCLENESTEMEGEE